MELGDTEPENLSQTDKTTCKVWNAYLREFQTY